MSASRTKQLSDIEYGYLDYAESKIISSEDIITKYGAVELTTTDNKQFEDFNKLVGTSPVTDQCNMCGHTECHGHIGNIPFGDYVKDDVARKVTIISPPYVATILDVLNLFCMECKTLSVNVQDETERTGLLDPRMEEVKKLPMAERLARIRTLVKRTASEKNKGTIRTCSNILRCKNINAVCSTKHVYNIDKTTGVITVEVINAADGKRGGTSSTRRGDSDSRKVIYSADMLLIALMEIKDSQYEYIGLTRDDVRAMFMTSLVVIPPKFRPSGKNKSKIRDYIDKMLVLRKTYVEQRVQKQKKKKKSGREDKRYERHVEYAANIFAHVKSYIELIVSMLKGKHGIMASKVAAKRTSGSRATIVPSDYGLQYLEVPEIAAREGNTRMELVKEDNIEALQALLDTDKITSIKPISGPYAGTEIRVAGDNITSANYYTLKVGDVVWRHLRDGDIAVTVRQPTQNQKNIYAAIVKITPHKTNKIHLSNTMHLAGDFDGDTMAIFVAYYGGAVQDMEKMLISRNLRSGQSNAPVCSITFNSPLAAAKLTQTDIIFTEDVFMTLAYKSVPEDYDFTDLFQRAAIHAVPKYSGRTIFSLGLPRDFSYKYTHELRGQKNVVKISDGILIRGVITGEVSGIKHGGIVDRLTMKYRFKESELDIPAFYINTTAKLLNTFLAQHGSTASIEDCMFDTLDVAKGLTLRSKLDEEFSEIHQKLMDLDEAKTFHERQRREIAVRNILSKPTSTVKDVYSAANIDENGLMYMTNLFAGAKGKESNVGWIGGVIGQQTFLNERLQKTLCGGRRVLVTHFSDSLDERNRGYIQSNYASGMRPSDVYAQSAGGRQGQTTVSTATKTLGDIEKNLYRTMENAVTLHGMSVANGYIINTSYGNDSMDSNFLTRINGSAQAVSVTDVVRDVNRLVIIEYVTDELTDMLNRKAQYFTRLNTPPDEYSARLVDLCRDKFPEDYKSFSRSSLKEFLEKTGVDWQHISNDYYSS